MYDGSGLNMLDFERYGDAEMTFLESNMGSRATLSESTRSDWLTLHLHQRLLLKGMFRRMTLSFRQDSRKA